MKFFTLFAGVAAATAVVKRDIGTVTSAIASIQSATSNLQDGINSFNGAGQVEELQSASQATIDAINQANSDVMGTDDLTTEDSLQLPGPINRLSSLVQDTVDALIAKKSAFDAAGVSSVVEQQSIMLRDASNTFSQTLLGKVPQGLQMIGRNLAAPISQALDRAVAAFANSGSGGSGSAGPTGTSSASSSSSTSSSGSASTTSTGSIAPYPTGSSSAAAAPTGGASVPASSPTEVTPPIYTGAAAQAGAGFGVAAVAALAAVAAF